jgi:hypothetical protein
MLKVNDKNLGALDIELRSAARKVLQGFDGGVCMGSAYCTHRLSDGSRTSLDHKSTELLLKYAGDSVEKSVGLTAKYLIFLGLFRHRHDLKVSCSTD